MDNAVTEIQKSLNLIRSEAEEEDWEFRLEVLEMMMATAERVVADLRKLKEPKVKKITKKVIVPKTQLVTRFVDAPAPKKKPSTTEPDFKPITPQPPLPAQQTV